MKHSIAQVTSTRSTWTLRLMAVLAGASAFSLAANPGDTCLAAVGDAQETVTQAAAQEETGLIEITNVNEFREALKDHGPEAVAATLQKWMQEGNSQVYAATAAVAMYHVQNDRDYTGAANAWLQGFEHFLQQVKSSANPSAQDLNGLISTAITFSSYAQRSPEHKAVGHKPLFEAVSVLLPIQEGLDGPDATTPAFIRLAIAAKKSGDSQAVDIQAFKKLMDEIAELTQSWLENNPDDLQSNLVFLQAQSITNPSLDDTLNLMESGLEKFPNESSIFSLYQRHILTSAATLSLSDPDSAAKLLDNLKSRVETNQGLDETTRKRTLASIDRTFKQITAANIRQELVGNTAPMFDAEAWANGEPVNPKELRGKVVLLDFWAVWCVPCIASFPHLRDWNEEYGQDGLVIVGVTRKYDYTWDDETNRASVGEEQSMEAEVAMLEKFLAHHEMEHRTMVTPEGSAMNDLYGVTGIPQVVLIDQSGIIRLIRVGNTEENSKAIHQMIETLLSEN